MSAGPAGEQGSDESGQLRATPGQEGDDRRSLAEERRDAGPPDPGRRTRDQDDLAGELAGRRSTSELRLLQVPVLHVEDVALGQCDPPFEQLRALDDVDRVDVQVLDDTGLGCAPSRSQQAELRVENHAGRRIEHAEARLVPASVLLERAGVRVDVRSHVAPEERQPLRADHVVGRGGTLLGDAHEVAPPGERRRRRALGESEDHGAARSPGDIASQLGERGADRVGGRRRLLAAELPGAPLVEVGLGSPHELDRPLVRLARGGSERHEAVVHQHDPRSLRAEPAGKLLREQPREEEAGHHVREDGDLVPVDLLDALPARRRVHDAQEGVGVRVIDERERDGRMQDRLDGWHRRRGIDRGRSELSRHLEVGQGLELGEPKELAQLHRGEALLLDRGQVPARALDVEQVYGLAEQVRLRHLDGGVPAAVEHERGIAAEEAGRVDPLFQEPLERGRLAVVPEAPHVLSPPRSGPSAADRPQARRLRTERDVARCRTATGCTLPEEGSTIRASARASSVRRKRRHRGFPEVEGAERARTAVPVVSTPYL